jgi:hypothetical protein
MRHMAGHKGSARLIFSQRVFTVSLKAIACSAKRKIY